MFQQTRKEMRYINGLLWNLELDTPYCRDNSIPAHSSSASKTKERGALYLTPIIRQKQDGLRGANSDVVAALSIKGTCINDDQSHVDWIGTVISSSFDWFIPSTEAAMDFTTVPVLDLSLAGSLTRTEPQFLPELRNALVQMGFFYLKNHSNP